MRLGDGLLRHVPLYGLIVRGETGRVAAYGAASRLIHRKPMLCILAKGEEGCQASPKANALSLLGRSGRRG